MLAESCLLINCFQDNNRNIDQFMQITVNLFLKYNVKSFIWKSRLQNNKGVLMMTGQ